MNFQELINVFIEGAKEGVAGTAKRPGNLKIEGNQLIHYNTPILERYGNKFILNITRYSLQTGQVQKKVKETIPEENLIYVKSVEKGPQTTLKSFIK